MTSKALLIISTVLIFVFAFALFYSQNLLSQKFEESAKRIDVVAERLQAALPKDTAKVAPALEAIHKAQLDLQRERVKVELEAQKQELFWYNISFLGIGSILGFISLLWLIPTEIAAKTKVAVDDKISDAINGRSEAIRHMLRQYDFESILLHTKKIFIAGAGGAQNARLKDFLEANGFASHNIYMDEQELSRHDFDLFFLNNMDFAFAKTPSENTPEQAKKSREDAMLLFVNDRLKSKACFFYYSDQREFFPIERIGTEELKSRINFASALSQIYGNVINLLKYQHRMGRS